MKLLQEENNRLKRRVNELSLAKTMLQDVLQERGNAVAALAAG